jgi:hypothetical protein
MAEIEFCEITDRHDNIAIVASGPSARGFSAPPGVTVIAVNGAVEWLEPAPGYWFTLDPGHRNRSRMLNRRDGTVYIAAVPVGFGTQKAPLHVMRLPAPAGVRYMQRMAGNGALSARPGLSDDPRRIHTGNGAYGALGLAYLMGATRIALFGVDASHARRIEGGRSSNLDHLPALFATAASQLDGAGVEVVNASPGSAIECFPKMTMGDALQWLSTNW